MKMKKVLASVLLLSMVVTGCSKKDKEEKKDGGPSTVTTGEVEEKPKKEESPKVQEENKTDEDDKEETEQEKPKTGEPVENVKEESFTDSEGKEYTKIPTMEMDKEEVTEDFINKWFFEQVVPSDAPYLNILYKGEKNKGVYATKEAVYVNAEFKELENGSLMPLHFDNEDLEVYAFTGGDKLEKTK